MKRAHNTLILIVAVVLFVIGFWSKRDVPTEAPSPVTATETDSSSPAASNSQQTATGITPEKRKSFTGRVVSVSDGDTLTVLDANNDKHRIRLEWIDAPEKDQAFGDPARDALSDKILRKTVRVEWDKKDQYDRILGHVYIRDRWINQEMVAEGWAWHYDHYSDNQALADAEQQAKAEHAGLWSGNSPLAPWKFRQKRFQENSR